MNLRRWLATFAFVFAWAGGGPPSPEAGAQPVVPGAQVPAVEYFHAGFGHYFLTAQPAEIALLDAGAIAGWERTGATFEVWSSGDGLVDVCRFFTSYFAPKASHFYTALAHECDGLKQNPVWQYETLDFKVAIPTDFGNCPAGVPLHRLYNNAIGGAPNHRYTTSAAVRQQMIAQGFVYEGATICVATAGTPPGPPTGFAEGLWSGHLGNGRAARAVVLDDGNFYLIYGTSTNALSVVGVVHGNVGSSGGAFTSNNAREFNFESFQVGIGSIAGQYASKSSLSGTIDSTIASTTFALAYDPGYDTPASLGQLAGSYSGQVDLAGVIGVSQSITLEVKQVGGVVSGKTSGCPFEGTVLPRGAVNVFDLTVTFQGGGCPLGKSTFTGIAVLEAGTGRLFAVLLNNPRTDVIVYVVDKQ